jgi:hypothetical protein
MREGTALTPGRVRSRPPNSTAPVWGDANACAGSWQLAHASDPEADRPGSKKSARPMAVSAAAEGVLSNEFE